MFITVTIGAGDSASSSHPLLASTTYTLLFGNSVVTTFTTDSTGNFNSIGISPAPTPSGSDVIEFAVPSMPSGYYPINLEISSTTINIINPQSSFYLITSAGSTPTVVIQDLGAQTYNTLAVPDNPAGVAVGHSASDAALYIAGTYYESIYVFAYNFPAGSSSFTVSSADGLLESAATAVTASSSTGAYFTGSSGSGIGINDVPGGNYLVTVTASNSAYGTQVASPSNAAIFTVIPYVFNPSTLAPKIKSYVGSTADFFATGLAPNTEYVGVFNGQVLTSSGIPVTYLSTSGGRVGSSSAPATFTVPPVYVSQTVGQTDYTFGLAPYSAPSNVVTELTVVVQWPTTISITPDPRAFPNELVSFTWTPLVEPPLASTMPIYVTIYLDGSAYETVLGTFNYVSANSSQSYITGSFKMPNGMPNTVFAVSFGWSTISISGSAVSSGSLLTLSPSTYTGKTMAPLELVNGTGASIVSISNASIAHIITSSINSALAIPLSELSANITALHGDIATITTAFGTMNATLQAINATVSSIEKGQALIKTDLGTISTTLSSINASIVSLNNNVVTINTTLGKVVTSLSSINATVVSTASGVSSLQGSAVTIITDLGNITGTVRSISNGIATIQTSLGNLTRNVSQIKTNTGKINTISNSLGTTEIFEIVILVLVLITLVLSFLAINAANRVAKKVEEQKKQ
ncbi:MAG: methyl-accepting chemotaxis protein [Candidatus Parvarchaeota archaeon]